MTKPLRHTIAPTLKNSVKRPLEDLLRTRSESPDKAVAETGLTNGEIVRALNLDKTRNGDVSAALNKLRSEGKLHIETGPRTSATGPRAVKRYRFKTKRPAKAEPAPASSDDRRYLSLLR